jgi:hypothetical protein
VAVVKCLRDNSIEALVSYRDLNWDDTFREWMAECRDRRGNKFWIHLNPLMRERIKVASWVCFHFVMLKWPDEYFHPAMLQARHFKAARQR